ncbi:hypothetical protein Dsin_002989 [Dipteronia sinensis]|uniref:Reverse transcriptase domain-containing protein n=1 Tax=Dipteronia sinensis TaxID=43782 RepID=A0AAE0B850_9ROSI|nr:hypothetical protein Dsin_002989 [Dipteronia sinensis]
MSKDFLDGPFTSDEIRQLLNEGAYLRPVNDTLVCLVPKVQSAQRIAEYRPISLCNIIYKVVAKVLANRLRCVLGEVISDTQSAFILRRLISNNAIIGYECIHALRTRRHMALKLDMRKTYNIVEWKFLDRMMIKLGFSEGWFRRVMGCVTIVLYSFLINGAVYGNVCPTRGLRQGDLMSLYLYLIVAEGLSYMIREAIAKGDYSCSRCNRSGPMILHLFFASDSLFSSGASSKGCSTIHEILDLYSKATCQLVNYEKSGMCFSKVVSRAEAYSMGLFKFPKGLLDDIHGVCNHFWWGSTCANWKLHWASWKRMCVGNDVGGMGFRNLHVFNKALLAKQRILCWGSKLIQAGSRWRIEACSSVVIYSDQWIPHPFSFKIISSKVKEDIVLVSQVKFASGGWNGPLLNELFVDDDVEAILSIPSSSSLPEDTMCWHFLPTGDDSIKNGYKLGLDLGNS